MQFDDKGRIAKKGNANSLIKEINKVLSMSYFQENLPKSQSTINFNFNNQTILEKFYETEIYKVKKNEIYQLQVIPRRLMGRVSPIDIEAKGEVVITMDADLQDSPDEIPELVRRIHKENFDLISGWKKKRFDPITKTVPTKLFNWAARKMSGIKLNDVNCVLSNR